MMDAFRVEFELLDDVKGQLEKQRPRPRSDQGIQAARQAIVVQRIFLRDGYLQRGRIDGANHSAIRYSGPWERMMFWMKTERVWA